MLLVMTVFSLLCYTSFYPATPCHQTKIVLAYVKQSLQMCNREINGSDLPTAKNDSLDHDMLEAPSPISNLEWNLYATPGSGQLK